MTFLLRQGNFVLFEIWLVIHVSTADAPPARPDSKLVLCVAAKWQPNLPRHLAGHTAKPHNCNCRAQRAVREVAREPDLVAHRLTSDTLGSLLSSLPLSRE